MYMNDILFSSNKMDWETPQDLFDKLNTKYNFTIDVASNELNHKCKRYYTEKEDGLKQDWSNERVYCNPPYGREIGKWVKKAFESKCLSVFLVPARTDTKWFHEFVYNKENVEYEFLKGRLKFVGSKNSAPFPSMIIIFKNMEV